MRGEHLQRLGKATLRPSARLPVFIAVYCLFFWAFVLLKPGSHHVIVIVDDGLGLLGTLVGTGLALHAWWHMRLSARAADQLAGALWAPLLIGLSLACNLIANTIWAYYDALAQEPPFPSWADPVYLCYYPLLLAAILLIPRARVQALVQARITVDGLIALCALVTFGWYFVLGPTLLQGDDSLLSRIIGTAYPLGDVLLLACLLMMWSRTPDPRLRPALVILSLGLCAVVVADTVFDYASLRGTYETGNPIDPLWGLSDLLVGLGAILLSRVYRASASRSASDVASDAAAMSTWRGLVPYGLLPAVGLLVLATAHVRGDEAYKPGIYVGASVLVALVVARQVLAIAENRRLYRQLAVKTDALTAANTRLTALAGERERQAATAQAFADLSASLTAVRETEAAYSAMLPQLSRMLSLTHAGVFEHHKGSIVLAAAWSQAESTLQLPRHDVVTSNNLDLHTGQSSWLLSTTPLASEAQRDGLWVEPLQLRSGMCVRLSVQGEVCGWLSVQSASPHAYDADSLHLLSEVGAHLELALGNVRLYAFEQQRARSAEALARLQEDFVAATSHELRTPLTTVLGYAEVLEGRWDQLTELQRKLKVQRIVVAANRQKRLIDDLLRVSSLEHEKLSVRRRPVEMMEVVARAMDVVNVSYANQPIDAAGPPDLVVLADDSFMEQVLVNLLDNAAKYSSEGSPIVVRWTQEDKMVAVRVRDYGPGIPQDGRDILFSRFGRLPGSRVRAGRVGTGLGLYLGREYTQAMGGTLDLESAGSTGSTFLLRLPIYQPEDQDVQQGVVEQAVSIACAV